MQDSIEMQGITAYLLRPMYIIQTMYPQNTINTSISVINYLQFKELGPLSRSWSPKKLITTEKSAMKPKKKLARIIKKGYWKKKAPPTPIQTIQFTKKGRKTKRVLLFHKSSKSKRYFTLADVRHALFRLSICISQFLRLNQQCCHPPTRLSRLTTPKMPRTKQIAMETKTKWHPWRKNEGVPRIAKSQSRFCSKINSEPKAWFLIKCCFGNR